MTRWATAIFLIGLPFLLAAWPADADQQVCHLYRIAALDMTTDDTGRVSVPMTVGGKTVNLLVDTGGSSSTLTESAVASLGLTPQRSFGAYATFYGGEVMNRYVLVHDAELGGMKGPQLFFWVMSDRRSSVDEGGTLAPDIMEQFDVDFDFANAKLGLFSQDHCEGRVVYWTQGPVAKVPFEADRDHHLKVLLSLDGKEITADVDTGAFASVGSLDAIEDLFSIDEKNPNLKLDPNANDKVHVYHYPFKALSFEGVTVYNPDIPLRPDDETHMRHKFLIGMNVLRRLHLYVAYREHAMYISDASAH